MVNGSDKQFWTNILPRNAADLRFSLVGGASLQRDLQDAVVQPDEERPVAVQDLQTQDGLAHTRREELQLLQVTTLQVLIGRGQRLQDGAIFWLDERDA